MLSSLFFTSKSSQKRFLTSTVVLLTLLSVRIVSAQPDEIKSEELFRAMQITEGSWAADIGSRDGNYTVLMAPVVGENGHIFAVDIDADALEDLHENLRDRSIANVTPVYSVIDNPMLPPAALDAVLIRNAYHEFTEYMSMLRHIRKSLKPGGRLVLAEPISEGLRYHSRERQAESHDIAPRFAREDLIRAGFEIVREEDPFTETRRGQHYWLIVAVRPEV